MLSNNKMNQEQTETFLQILNSISVNLDNIHDDLVGISAILENISDSQRGLLR